MSAVDWMARASRSTLDGYPEAGAAAALVALAEEQRTANLLAAAQVLGGELAADAAELAAVRLGLDVAQ